MSLTLYHAIRTSRSSSNTLQQTLYRDGFFYFVCIFRGFITDGSTKLFSYPMAVISAGNIIVLSVGPVSSDLPL